MQQGKPLPPTEIGLSRSNLEAMVWAWMQAKYAISPQTHTITFNWNHFPSETYLTVKPKVKP